MTDTSVPATAPISDPVGEGHGATHHGPPDKYYVRIAAGLAGITALEVVWTYLPWGEGTAWVMAEVGGLLLMMAIKFVVVASNFMHLKFDDKILTRVFYAGLILAVGVYLAALTTFELFGGGGGSPGFH